MEDVHHGVLLTGQDRYRTLAFAAKYNNDGEIFELNQQSAFSVEIAKHMLVERAAKAAAEARSQEELAKIQGALSKRATHELPEQTAVEQSTEIRLEILDFAQKTFTGRLREWQLDLTFLSYENQAVKVNNQALQEEARRFFTIPSNTVRYRRLFVMALPTSCAALSTVVGHGGSVPGPLQLACQRHAVESQTSK
ncbi:hypothetical protein H2199_008368 [Coniosporium tulheliwenetii]|uniref:Uncharacterized protein n=1 Tax=Coniosporium tulheliwenetii TaxID=3383036 RepID=A0ACC2YJ50_9PEZI|nr:hypothetical protein H2199_008368 [Cladosporium sp. JES 115]